MSSMTPKWISEAVTLTRQALLTAQLSQLLLLVLHVCMN